jgi:hypothetical protein
LKLRIIVMGAFLIWTIVGSSTPAASSFEGVLIESMSTRDCDPSKQECKPLVTTLRYINRQFDEVIIAKEVGRDIGEINIYTDGQRVWGLTWVQKKSTLKDRSTQERMSEFVGDPQKSCMLNPQRQKLDSVTVILGLKVYSLLEEDEQFRRVQLVAPDLACHQVGELIWDKRVKGLPPSLASRPSEATYPVRIVPGPVSQEIFKVLDSYKESDPMELAHDMFLENYKGSGHKPKDLEAMWPVVSRSRMYEEMRAASDQWKRNHGR